MGLGHGISVIPRTRTKKIVLILRKKRARLRKVKAVLGRGGPCPDWLFIDVEGYIHRSISAHNVRPPSMTMTAPSPLKQHAYMLTLQHSHLDSNRPPHRLPTHSISMPPRPTPSAAALTACHMQRMSLTSPVPPTLPNSSIPSSKQPVPPTLPSTSNTSASTHSHGLPPQVPSFALPQLRMPPPPTAAR